MRSCERALLFPAAKTDYRFIILVTKTNVVCINRTVTLSFLADLLPFLKVSLSLRVVGFVLWSCYTSVKRWDNFSILIPIHILSFRTRFLPHPLSLLYLMDSLATRPSLSFSLSLSRSNWEHRLRPPHPFFISMHTSMGRARFWDSMVMCTVHTFLFPNHAFRPHSVCFDSLTYLVIALSGTIRFLAIVYLASSYSGLFWPAEL